MTGAELRDEAIAVGALGKNIAECLNRHPAQVVRLYRRDSVDPKTVSRFREALAEAVRIREARDREAAIREGQELIAAGLTLVEVYA